MSEMFVHGMIIEDGILKAYFGDEDVVVVPSGVISIGGVLSEDDRYRRRIIGDPIDIRLSGATTLFARRFCRILPRRSASSPSSIARSSRCCPFQTTSKR